MMTRKDTCSANTHSYFQLSFIVFLSLQHYISSFIAVSRARDSRGEIKCIKYVPSAASPTGGKCFKLYGGLGDRESITSLSSDQISKAESESRVDNAERSG